MCVCVDVYTCVLLWECAHVHIQKKKKETRGECQAFLLRPARIFFSYSMRNGAGGMKKGRTKRMNNGDTNDTKGAAAAHRVICTHVHIQQPFWSKIIILAIHCGPENIRKSRLAWLCGWNPPSGISPVRRDCQSWSSPTIPAMPAWIFSLLVRCCLGCCQLCHSGPSSRVPAIYIRHWIYTIKHSTCSLFYLHAQSRYVPDKCTEPCAAPVI